MANTVSFQAPNEFQTEADDIARRRKYAEMLQQQSMAPIASSPNVPISWTQGLAKMLQAYTAGKGLERATTESKALGERYTTERGQALAGAMRAGMGTPGTSETIMDEQAMGGEGAPAQINAPAVAGNRQAMLAQLMGSKFPDLQQAGMTQMMTDQKPVVLGRTLVRPGDGSVVATDSTWQDEQKATRDARRDDLEFKISAAERAGQDTANLRRELAGMADTTRRDLASQSDATRRDLAGQSAGLRRDIASAAGGKPQKAPVGYRFSSDGETLEPIPGGPKDASAKPLPTQALKLQQAEVDAIGGAAAINADLATVRQQLETGKLKLGLGTNLVGQARNYLGVSNENSQNLATFRATMERMRNESLRLNKGVQTEGDSVRAWNELFQNINDTEVVKKRLAEIEATNARAVDLRKMNVDNIRMNYGAEPLDVSAQRNQPSAIGATPETPARRATDKPAAPSGVQEGDTATGPGGKKIIYRGGKWVPNGR